MTLFQGFYIESDVVIDLGALRQTWLPSENVIIEETFWTKFLLRRRSLEEWLCYLKYWNES